MRTHILSAVLTGVLGLAAVGCGDSGRDDGSLSEAALKTGTLDDAGVCVCPGKKDKAEKDAGKPEKEAKAEKDAGGKPEKEDKADAGKGSEEHGKSDEEHGKGGKDGGADEDEATDEDALEDDDFEALKVTPDGGAKGKKPKTDKGDCSC
jgi:hypothetical protein